MSMWKRFMSYLGLDEDGYDDYEDPSEAEADRRSRSTRPGGQVRMTEPVDPTGGQVRAFPAGRGDADTGARRFPLASHDDSGIQPRPLAAVRQGSTVRTVAPGGEPHTVRPRQFEDAQEVGDRFRAGQSVILNLEATDPKLSHRLIDFASGLCYGLNGSIEKVATGVFLLKPASARGRDDRDGGTDALGDQD
jgi:cell division inhibitor SepF